MRSTRRHPLLRALALLSALAAPLPARATPLEDPATGLRLATNTAGAQVCRIIPPPDRAGSAACDGLDVADIAAKMRSAGLEATAVALLRYPEWAAVVVLNGQVGSKIINRESIDAFLSGVRGSLPGRVNLRGESKAGAEYDVIKINGVDAVRTSGLLDVPETHPARGTSSMRIYVFTSRTGSAVVTFGAPPEHTAELDAAADAIVATVSMPNAGVKHFGRSRYEILGEAIGDLVVALVPVIGIVAFFVNRHRQRKKVLPLPQHRA